MSALKGLDGFLYKLEKLEEFRISKEAENIAINVVLETVPKNIPVLTGELEESLFVNPIANGIVYGFSAPHSVYTNFGTGIYYNYSDAVVKYSVGVTRTIGRQDRWTYYNAKQGGFYTTAGQKPQHWFEGYAKEVEERIIVEINKRLEEIL